MMSARRVGCGGSSCTARSVPNAIGNAPISALSRVWLIMCLFSVGYEDNSLELSRAVRACSVGNGGNRAKNSNGQIWTANVLKNASSSRGGGPTRRDRSPGCGRRTAQQLRHPLTGVSKGLQAQACPPRAEAARPGCNAPHTFARRAVASSVREGGPGCQFPLRV